MNKIVKNGPATQPPPVPKIRIAEDGTPIPVAIEPGGYEQWLDHLAKALGTADPTTAVALLQQAMNASGSALDRHDREIMANTVIALMADIRPQSSAELMLAVQMIAVHFQATRLMQQAAATSLPEISRKQMALADRLFKTFVMQIQALRKSKLRGRQKMIVEHVHIHEGGQAIVGNVENHPGGRAK